MTAVTCLDCYFCVTASLDDIVSKPFSSPHAIELNNSLSFSATERARAWEDDFSFLKPLRVIHCYLNKQEKHTLDRKPLRSPISESWEEILGDTLKKDRICASFCDWKITRERNKFYEIESEQKRKCKEQSKSAGKKAKEEIKKTRLSSKKIKFDDVGSKILIGKKTVDLPPNRNEHDLCRVMFKARRDKWISWDIVYEKITGKECGKPSELHWHKVYDAMEAVNNRVKKAVPTDDDLFTWSELTIKRNI